MKKLYCAVVTDPSEEIGLDSPIIFHVNAESADLAMIVVREELVKSYEDLDRVILEYFDIFIFEVREVDILDIDLVLLKPEDGKE